MAINVSNVLMLLVQQIKKKTASTHHHSENESYKVGLCVLRAALSLSESTKIDALMAFPLEVCSKIEALKTIYNLAP